MNQTKAASPNVPYLLDKMKLKETEDVFILLFE